MHTFIFQLLSDSSVYMAELSDGSQSSLGTSIRVLSSQILSDGGVYMQLSSPILPDNGTYSVQYSTQK